VRTRRFDPLSAWAAHEPALNGTDSQAHASLTTQPRSLDLRRRARPHLTAIASALRCPTRTTRRVPRAIPAYTLLPMPPPSAIPSFTPKQGQYLAFIYAYTRVLGRPPAEADLQRHFGVSPPSVHQMVLTLERTGLIRRHSGVARSIEVLVSPEQLPVLR
jgi:hypothetical protein